jgi:hypothetical protein
VGWRLVALSLVELELLEVGKSLKRRGGRDGSGLIEVGRYGVKRAGWSRVEAKVETIVK